MNCSETGEKSMLDSKISPSTHSTAVKIQTTRLYLLYSHTAGEMSTEKYEFRYSLSAVKSSAFMYGAQQ